jgi:hypothetical protein
MKVGFTGTQNGLTIKQKAALQAFLNTLQITEFHHGDCIGADAQAHSMVSPDVVHKHPSTVEAKRAYCKGGKVYPARAPLDRNHDIIKAGKGLIIACPKASEEQRSGTWMTVRHSRTAGRKIKIVWPNGLITDGEVPEEY